MTNIGYNFGTSYRALQKFSEAGEALEKAIELDPKDCYNWNRLGYVYLDAGEDSKAFAAFQKAIELSPERGNMHYSLIQCLRKLGRKDEGRTRNRKESGTVKQQKESDYDQACFEIICQNKDQALRVPKNRNFERSYIDGLGKTRSRLERNP